MKRRRSLKQLERAVRRRYLRGHAGSFTGTLVTHSAAVLDLPPRPRILLLRQDRIGDVLVTVPVVRALRRHLPDADIHFLMSRNNVAARGAIDPFVDHVWRYDKRPGDVLRLLRAFRRARYDVLVDLMDNPSATSTLLTRWSGARYRLGIMKDNATAYTHCVPLLDVTRVHIVERIAQLLLPFGIDPAAEPLDLAYPVSEAEARAAAGLLPPRARPVRLGINVSGRAAGKFWGVDNFAALARWVRERYPEVEAVICGAPEYAEQVAAIAAQAGVLAAPPIRSLHEFAALVHGFDAVVTPDTSVVHLAAAWKIPSVVLYRQPVGGPIIWHPWRTPHRSLVDPVGIGQIPLPAVQDALADLLATDVPAMRGRTAVT